MGIWKQMLVEDVALVLVRVAFKNNDVAITDGL